jgi:PAS domain-containing protein
VVLGVTSRMLAPILATPVGALTPVEVHGHALLSVTDGARLQVPGRVPRLAIVVLFALATLLALSQLRTRRALVLVALLGLGAVVLDYVLFRSACLLWGASAPLAAVIFSSTTFFVDEHRRAHNELKAVARGLRRRVRLEARSAEVEDELWRRIDRVSAMYLASVSSIFAELPPGGTHLLFAHCIGCVVEDIAERRREVHRPPYQAALSTLRPVRCTGFMEPSLGLQTIIAPVVIYRAEAAADARSSAERRPSVAGFWIVNIPEQAGLTQEQVGLLDTVVREIVVALSRRPGGEVTATPLLLQSGGLAEEVQEVQRSIQTLSKSRREFATLFEAMPVGVLITNLWGELRQSNAAMREALGGYGIGDLEGANLASLLTKLTGWEDERTQATLRGLVKGEPEIAIVPRPQPRRPGPPPHQFVLSLKTRGSTASSGELATFFVLTANRRAPDSMEAQSTAQWAGVRPTAPEPHEVVIDAFVDSLVVGLEGIDDEPSPLATQPTAPLSEEEAERALRAAKTEIVRHVERHPGSRRRVGRGA